MSLFREIWKKSILCNQQMVIKDDQKGNTVFRELLDQYPEDGMVYFERGIAFEIMGKYGLAKLDYEKAKELFPVPHWQKNADFFIERVSLKKSNFNYISNKNSLNDFKLDVLYLIHSYVFIPDKIRYLAISSVSRIDSEPEMAIIVFRTCIETALKKLRNIPDTDRTHLEDLIIDLIDKKIIPVELKQDFKCIRDKGNEAVHTNVDSYKDYELVEILDHLNICMDFINEKYKEKAHRM